MLNNPVEDQGNQLRKLQARWLGLPLSYRVNALLYLGGGLLLLFLVITIIAGGDSTPRPIQVGAGANTPTTAPRGAPIAGGPVTTGGGPTSSTSTTGPGATTTTAPRVTNQATIPANLGLGSGLGGAGAGAGAAAGAGTGSDADGGGDGAGGGGGGEDTTPSTSPPETTTTTEVEIKPCRDSQEARCGNFSWDPAPAPNQPLKIGDVRATAAARVGQPFQFEVPVTDPDHLVSDYCSQVRYSDGGNNDGPCSPPPCPPRHGPWRPPDPQSNIFTPKYTHTFATTGSFTVTLTFRSWSPDRCLAIDPYASEHTRTVRIDVGT